MRTSFICLFVFLFAGTIGLPAQVNVLIAYHSETGNTARMAEAVAQGAMEVRGVRVIMKPTGQVREQDLLDADAIIVGSPVYNANVSPEIQKFISGWPFENMPLRNKVGAAFVSAGGISAGEELTQMNMLQSMLVFGMIVVGGPDWMSPFGASAVVHEAPFGETGDIAPQFLEKGRQLGVRVAEITLRFNHARQP